MLLLTINNFCYWICYLVSFDKIFLMPLKLIHSMWYDTNLPYNFHYI